MEEIDLDDEDDDQDENEEEEEGEEEEDEEEDSQIEFEDEDSQIEFEEIGEKNEKMEKEIEGEEEEEGEENEEQEESELVDADDSEEEESELVDVEDIEEEEVEPEEQDIELNEIDNENENEESEEEKSENESKEKKKEISEKEKKRMEEEEKKKKLKQKIVEEDIDKLCKLDLEESFNLIRNLEKKTYGKKKKAAAKVGLVRYILNDDDKSGKCLICQCEYRDVAKHVSRCHIWDCTACNIPFNTREQFVEHKRKVKCNGKMPVNKTPRKRKPDEVLSDRDDDKSFKKKKVSDKDNTRPPVSKYAKYKNQTIEDLPFFCEFCGPKKRFRANYTLVRHLRKYHRDLLTEDPGHSGNVLKFKDGKVVEPIVLSSDEETPKQKKKTKKKKYTPPESDSEEEIDKYFTSSDEEITASEEEEESVANSDENYNGEEDEDSNSEDSSEDSGTVYRKKNPISEKERKKERARMIMRRRNAPTRNTVGINSKKRNAALQRNNCEELPGFLLSSEQNVQLPDFVFRATSPKHNKKKKKKKKIVRAPTNVLKTKSNRKRKFDEQSESVLPPQPMKRTRLEKARVISSKKKKPSKKKAPPPPPLSRKKPMFIPPPPSRPPTTPVIIQPQIEGHTIQTSIPKKPMDKKEHVANVVAEIKRQKEEAAMRERVRRELQKSPEFTLDSSPEFSAMSSPKNNQFSVPVPSTFLKHSRQRPPIKPPQRREPPKRVYRPPPRGGGRPPPNFGPGHPYHPPPMPHHGYPHPSQPFRPPPYSRQRQPPIPATFLRSAQSKRPMQPSANDDWEGPPGPTTATSTASDVTDTLRILEKVFDDVEIDESPKIQLSQPKKPTFKRRKQMEEKIKKMREEEGKSFYRDPRYDVHIPPSTTKDEGEKRNNKEGGETNISQKFSTPVNDTLSRVPSVFKSGPVEKNKAKANTGPNADPNSKDSRIIPPAGNSREKNSTNSMYRSTDYFTIPNGGPKPHPIYERSSRYPPDSSMRYPPNENMDRRRPPPSSTSSNNNNNNNNNSMYQTSTYPPPSSRSNRPPPSSSRSGPPSSSSRSGRRGRRSG